MDTWKSVHTSNGAQDAKGMQTLMGCGLPRHISAAGAKIADSRNVYF